MYFYFNLFILYTFLVVYFILSISSLHNTTYLLSKEKKIEIIFIILKFNNHR